MDTSKSEVTGVRTGARLLETLTSALYADPIVVFREYVQNAIDSFASASETRDFKVEITLDPVTRKILIRDNGDGIPCAKFDEIMMSLGKSPKDGQDNQIGFRGIGRLAGLSFCKTLLFVNKKTGQMKQTFTLSGEKYRKVLSEKSGGNFDLDRVMNLIRSTDSVPEDPEGDWTFQVTLDGVTDELIDCIYRSKPTRGRSGKQSAPELNNDSKPTDEFINELSMLLPVPYTTDFDGADKIRESFENWFGIELGTKEFKVFLDGEQLFKPFKNSEGTDFQILPIRILPFSKDNQAQAKELKTIGLLWMRFDFVFKAMKQDWGIAVRSKNMLVRGGAVLAEEAADDNDAVTSYGQYLSAIKGVTGELLLETDCLSDNSRRDWFKVDKNSMQLRNQLCQLMNRMHVYRYKISRYMHNDKRSDEEKQAVIQAYRDFVSQKNTESSMTSIEQYITERFQKENEREPDERADERDILGYTTTEKRFYRRLMRSIYTYFEGTDITHYYALKSHVLRDLNDDPLESDEENPNA